MAVAAERATGSAIPGDYIDQEASQGRMGSVPMALVAESQTGRRDLAVDRHQLEAVDESAILRASLDDAKLPKGSTRGTFGGNALGRYYGFFEFADYFLGR